MSVDEWLKNLNCRAHKLCNRHGCLVSYDVVEMELFMFSIIWQGRNHIKKRPLKPKTGGRGTWFDLLRYHTYLPKRNSWFRSPYFHISPFDNISPFDIGFLIVISDKPDSPARGRKVFYLPPFLCIGIVANSEVHYMVGWLGV
jgi:hypothetical protein